jgi:hypothetical protein
MGAPIIGQGTFLRTTAEGKVDLDAEQFLTEVQAQFKSEEILGEVRLRLDALTEIAAQPEMELASDALRDRLTQIFTAGGSEDVVLTKLRDLTEVTGPKGQKIDLRRFVKRERRVLSEAEYREALARKIANTNAHVVNLTAFFPESVSTLQQLDQDLRTLSKNIRSPAARVGALKAQEDKLRQTPAFRQYEELKLRFLKDWLGRFGDLSAAELSKLSPVEVQRMIQEHQRHQMTHLLKTRIKLLDTDMTEHLGLHDTLEGDFQDAEFWKGANIAAKNGFKQWVLGVVQAFGMLRGQRYAFFQSEDNKEQYLLFGLGLPSLEGLKQEPVRLVTYIKPFTRKGTYLLEVRKRDIGETDEYHHEILHYTLPFVFAFDQMRDFKLNSELVSFFTSHY